MLFIGPIEPPPVSMSPVAAFLPTNAEGQRICRLCGLPGRYKDGKCVERWGPSPMGPGIVCDRSVLNDFPEKSAFENK